MIYAVGIMIFLIILGFTRLRLKYTDIDNDYKFIQDYLNRFIAFTNQYGKSGAAGIIYQDYDWLLRRSTKAQRMIGRFGIYIYKHRFNGFSSDSYELIVNILPQFPDSSVESQLIIVTHQSLTLYLGDIEDRSKELAKELKNPFICFREGVNTIFQVPLWVLKWFGLLSENRVRNASQNWLFKLSVAVSAIIGFISALVTIADGWEKLLPFLLKIASFLTVLG
ncbi:hypothetical protein [Dyadobacter sp. CY312]|uniref:hypothetical protein n=1 Tax=Dyadobacter sp. CY312 TaxID=2907303 RepID=UPI001F3FD8EB|nr:hypothetical protein [Dyadobacter sp. CY312]MCE7039880.1 hypothetical protein [Dyadobacter sp. CY312]